MVIPASISCFSPHFKLTITASYVFEYYHYMKYLIVILFLVSVGACSSGDDSSGGNPLEPGVIYLSEPNYELLESIAVHSITVYRTGGAKPDISVDYTITAVTATESEDYTVAEQSGQLTFGLGESSKTLTVDLIDDALVEGTETLSIALSNPTGGAELVTPDNATISILDDDSGGEIAFANPMVSVNESAGTIQIAVERSNGAAAGISVDYTISPGTATPGADYDSTVTFDTLTFAAGETSKSIGFTVLEDAIEESTDTVLISLSNPLGGASLGGNDTLTLSIMDNDTPPVSGTSVAFVANASGQQQEYATQTLLPADFGVGEFSFQLWIKPDDSYPVGPTPSGTDARKAVNWSDADNEPYSSNDWWWPGNFLLDGHNNGTFANGTFSLQFYGSGRIRWLFGDGGSQLLGVQAYPASNTASLLDGNWHQVTLVRRWSGTGGSLLELWIDGLLVATETSLLQTNMRNYWNDWSGFISGQYGWFWGAEKNAAVGAYTYEDYKGLVDEVRFWSRALSSTEISTGYNQAVTGLETGLVGLFRLDDGTGMSSCSEINTNQCITMVLPPSGWTVWAQENAPLQ